MYATTHSYYSSYHRYERLPLLTNSPRLSQVLNLEREELKLRDQLEAIYALGLDYSVGDPDEGKNVKMGPPLQTPLVSAKYKGKYKKPGMMTSW
jgi:hypothetical protein